MADILVVDDDQSIATAFAHFFQFEGHAYRLASNAADALRLINERRPDLVMMDVRMPGVDGLSALKKLRSVFPDLSVVMMTGYGTSQTSIDAIRAGAFDYLTKPLDLDELRVVIQKVLDAQQTRATSEGSVVTDVDTAPRLVGDTAGMRDVYKTIGRLATLHVSALVVGEHGTGKQLVVATIHENSARRDQPLTVIDCAGTPEATIEAELFEQTSGTVQLTNIEALPPALQARLARALGHSFPRAAASAPQVRARVLASTEADLASLSNAGSFNRELYTAVAVVTVKMPPLRERREDIPLLVRHFIWRFNAEFDRTIAGVDDRAMRLVQEHTWPGNVAELESVIKRGCILARSDVITIDEIGESLSQPRLAGRREAESALTQATRTALQERLVAQHGSPSSAYHDIIDLVEATLVGEALLLTNANQVKAATILGVNRATLRKKMQAG